MSTVTIARRFRGPATSGNGGYVAGLVAEAFDPSVSVEVTLRSPPPLEQELTLTGGDGAAQVSDAGSVVATAAVTRLDLEAPTPVSLAEATEASKRFRCWDVHPLQECFVCGTARQPGDGLCIHPGAVDPIQVAAPWTPDATVGVDGKVDRRVVWAALDCPSYFGLGDDAPYCLLGRLTATIERLPAVGEPCVVQGWAVGSEGRKHYGASALFTAEGERLAVSRAVWIEIKRTAD